MMIRDRTSAELFEFIRSADVKNTPTLRSILDSYSIGYISADEAMHLLRSEKKKILLIDARSEKEFEETSLPRSLNFPVLNNHERHSTGLIYKKYSQTSALWLAMQYAEPKAMALKTFLENNNASDSEIIVYCWRGGGRSGYLSKMIIDLGYKVKAIAGGYRSYRRTVTEFFSNNIFPYSLIELSGLTGSGKTDLLKSVSDKLPVIDLENSARHFSSLLGQIPYDICSIDPVKNQTAYENNVYSNIYFGSGGADDTIFLIESESKKVGNFEIPPALFMKMQNSPSLNITASVESRVYRIVRDYFGEDLRGITLMKKKMKEKEVFFRQQLSNKLFSELIELLDKERVHEFTEIMIREYYDKRYKDKGKKPLAFISTDNIITAKEELIEVYKKYIKTLL